MVKLNVLYPATPGARFDHAYYFDKHMPMVGTRLDCLYYSIDRGVGGGQPGAASPFLAGCSVVCESVEQLHEALGRNGGEIMADIPNYTDVQPVVWISEVVMERS